MKITAQIFIPAFVALIVAFGYSIAYISRKLNGRITRRSYMIGVLALITSILGGIILMFQPWTPKLFNLGFDLVLIGTLSFTVWSHVIPAPNKVLTGEH